MDIKDSPKTQRPDPHKTKLSSTPPPPKKRAILNASAARSAVTKRPIVGPMSPTRRGRSERKLATTGIVAWTVTEEWDEKVGAEEAKGQQEMHEPASAT